MSKNDRKVKIVDVTPALAERWLNSNTHNRPLRNTLVAKFALSMKAGEWKLTSEPVAFSKPFIDSEGTQHKETLIEGQHRLYAIIESGITVKMTVWWNCEPDEFKVMGQGSVRTQGDILSINDPGLKDPTLTAGIAGAIIRFGFSYSNSLSAWQTQAMMAAFRNELIATTEDKKRLRKMAGRPAISALFLGRLVNPGMMDVIITQLRDAVGFTEHDPIRALHMFLQEQIQVGGKRDTVDVVFLKTCHAICAKLRGDRLKILRITPEGLAWLRDATKNRIEPVVREINGGRMPKNFWTPTMMTGEELPPINLDRVEQLSTQLKG